MTWSCAELFSQEMAAACFQAEAAVYAGEVQAAAATAAGRMTLWAGILALAAALVAAIVGYCTVRNQIEANKKLQAHAQKSEVKINAYLSVVTGLYGSLAAISRMSNVQFIPQDALDAYQAEAHKVAQIHMVAPLNVMEDVLTAVEKVAATYVELSVEHLRLHKAGQLHQDRWSAFCLGKINALAPPLTKAAVSMRADIDIPIDHQLYVKLVQSILDRVDVRTREALAEIKQITTG